MTMTMMTRMVMKSAMMITLTIAMMMVMMVLVTMMVTMVVLFAIQLKKAVPRSPEKQARAMKALPLPSAPLGSSHR